MAKGKKNSIWSNNWIVGTGTAVLGVFMLRIIDAVADTTILNSIWNFFKSLFLSLGKYFNTSFYIPLWGILLIGISGVGLLILILWIMSLFQMGNTSTPNVVTKLEAPFLNYKSDTFDGNLYKWEYEKNYSGKYDIINFVAYCSKDNCILHYGSCPICKRNYYDLKTNEELGILVRHRIEDNLYSR